MNGYKITLKTPSKLSRESPAPKSRKNWSGQTFEARPACRKSITLFSPCIHVSTQDENKYQTMFHFLRYPWSSFTSFNVMSIKCEQN